MRRAYFAGWGFAAIGVGASILWPSTPAPFASAYADVVHAAAGAFSACAFLLLQRRLGPLCCQTAWGRGWRVVRAGCMTLAGAGGLAALRPLVAADVAFALAAGGLALAAGLGMIALDLGRVGGASDD